MYEKIDLLQETEDYYFIDYIPYKINNPKFLELEEYFLKEYLPLFAEKVARIVLKVMYYYPCKAYLTQPTKMTPKGIEITYDADIRHYLPDKFVEIIKQVIMTDFSSLQILFSEPQFLISVCGEFSVTIYGVSKEPEVINILQQLVSQEGLYLKQNEIGQANITESTEE